MSIVMIVTAPFNWSWVYNKCCIVTITSRVCCRIYRTAHTLINTTNRSELLMIQYLLCQRTHPLELVQYELLARGQVVEVQHQQVVPVHALLLRIWIHIVATVHMLRPAHKYTDITQQIV